MRKFAGDKGCDKYQLCEDARAPNFHLSEQPIIPNNALFAVYKSSTVRMQLLYVVDLPSET